MSEQQTVQDNSVPVDFSIDWGLIGEGLDDLENQMLPFMAFGVPYIQVARYFGIHKSTISKRLSRNPHFAQAVAEARKVIKWELHRVWLNNTAVMAWANVEWYLGLDPFEKDEEDKFVYTARIRLAMFNEKAKMSRFIIDQLGLRVHKVEVEHNAPKPIFVGDETAAAAIVDALSANPEVETDPRKIAENYRLLPEPDDVEVLTMEEAEKSSVAPYSPNRRKVE